MEAVAQASCTGSGFTCPATKSYNPDELQTPFPICWFVVKVCITICLLYTADRLFPSQRRCTDQVLSGL